MKKLLTFIVASLLSLQVFAAPSHQCSVEAKQNANAVFSLLSIKGIDYSQTNLEVDENGESYVISYYSNYERIMSYRVYMNEDCSLKSLSLISDWIDG